MYLSNGNMKLKGDISNQFLVWSLPAIVTCPSRTAMCEKYCYARKAERMYPATRAARAQNLIDCESPDFVKNMKFMIAGRLSRGKKTWFRIHEAGDFYSMEYFNKWVEIAEAFPDVTFAAYTKSLDYIHGNVPENFVIRFSIWADTKPEEIKRAMDMGLPTYTALEKLAYENTTAIKCGGDCQTCKMCYTKKAVHIVNKIH